MKHSKFGMLMLFSLMMVACTNYGYPGEVYIPRDGGERVVEGDAPCYYVSIADYEGHESSSDDTWLEGKDTIVVKFRWLTVKRVQGETKLFIKADSNPTSKSRTLYIDGMVDDHAASIKVKQK